jgi:hypothetical protein
MAPLGLALGLAACAAIPPAPIDETGPIAVADRLYLGGSSPMGPVTDADWERFVGEVVTPLFPDGLTLWRAQGQWRNADGSITREPVMVIEILHSGEAGTEARLETIARAYRTRFAQEAVLRATAPVEARLVR